MDGQEPRSGSVEQEQNREGMEHMESGLVEPWVGMARRSGSVEQEEKSLWRACVVN